MDGDSNWARKAYCRRMESYGVSIERPWEESVITFGLVDLVGVAASHGYVRVIWATIANYEVTRVFVDSGSLVNILFNEAFDRMQADSAELNPTFISLCGFAQYEVKP